MVYFVIEFQSGDTGAALIYKYNTYSEAEYKYYDTMRAASASSVPKHGAILFDENMNMHLFNGVAHRETPSDIMLYYVLEFQTGGEVDAVIPVYYTDRAIAEQKYHQVLAAAAVSSVPKHGVIMVTSDMFEVKKEMAYRAPVVEEEEPEVEPETV